MNLSDSLREIGLELGRLKTGTPPRLNRRSLNLGKTEVQPGDEPVPYFTYWKEDLFHVEHPEHERARHFPRQNRPNNASSTSSTPARPVSRSNAPRASLRSSAAMTTSLVRAA